jgi:hypothetical protein
MTARAAIGCVLASAFGCHGQASPDECRAAVDRYVDLAVREMPGHVTFTPSQAAAVSDVERGVKRAVPAFRAVEDRCETLTRAQVACALGAASTRDWEACIPAGDGGAR